MATRFPDSRYKPGEVVPESGVYRVLHSQHRSAHESTLREGETFPACRNCGGDVRFEQVTFLSSLGKPNLLLVDDENSVRSTLKQVLQKDGYKVSTADSCSQALSLLNRRAYDAVITEMDVDTDLAGLDLARSIKKLNPSPPIILSTGTPTREKLQAALRLRINYVVIKPIDLQELKQALSRLIARRSALSGATAGPA